MPRLPVVELSISHDAGNQVLQVHIQEIDFIRYHCELQHVVEPSGGDPSNPGTRHYGEDVPVAQDDHSGLQRWHYAPLHSVPEIGGVKEVEGKIVKDMSPLGAVYPAARERGAPESRVGNGKTLCLQPFLEQRYLGGPPDTVGPFDHDEAAGQRFFR